MRADLHTHTTASDGQYTPAQLVRIAKERGLQILAVTDHDTLDGLEEAVSAGEAVDLYVLRGVELGAKEHRNLHILGYGFSKDAPELNALCAFEREQRKVRNDRMIAFLCEKGIDISLDEVVEQARGEIIGRPHFAQVMVKRGYVSTTREAFDRYLDTEEYENIRVAKIPAQTCVETIKADGGKVSLAHPYQLGYSNEKLEELVCQMKDWGLDAIECFYPRHSPEQTEFYLSLAKKYGLQVTGGSDFHGERVKPDISLSAMELDLAWLLEEA